MGYGKKIDKVAVFGLQGSGKSYLVNKLFVENNDYCFLFDPQGEHTDAKFRYIPKNQDNFDKLSTEMNAALKKIIIPNCNKLENKKRFKEALDVVVFDEADLMFPAGKQMPQYARKFWVDSRHYMLSNLVTVTRRFTDINIYIRDTADHLVVFKQAGATELAALEKFSTGARDAMQNDIDYDKHNFLYFDRSRKFEVMSNWKDLKQRLNK
ncbi:MAG: DUF87 domain-containing protein [Methanosarcinales archaeon]|jgi:GTPase SAR1 family protein|nr:DUF87 domain-containing protein [Methanosarcinales archaeon]